MEYPRQDIALTIAQSIAKLKDGAQKRVRFCDINREVYARITAIHKHTPETLRLQEMGLTVGAIFKVEKIAPFGDPIEISVRGYRLCLRKREASEIEIELIDEVGE